MKTVTLNTVRTRLDSLLRRVAGGEEIDIVERRKPVARLVPPRAAKIDWSETFSRLDQIWGRKPLPEKAGSQIIKQGRR
jgi:antitoxin (DNA-binding transcriptional repressor) of toxin-antitoxin stability system